MDETETANPLPVEPPNLMAVYFGYPVPTSLNFLALNLFHAAIDAALSRNGIALEYSARGRIGQCLLGDGAIWVGSPSNIDAAITAIMTALDELKILQYCQIASLDVDALERQVFWRVAYAPSGAKLFPFAKMFTKDGLDLLNKESNRDIEMIRKLGQLFGDLGASESSNDDPRRQ